MLIQSYSLTSKNFYKLYGDEIVPLSCSLVTTNIRGIVFIEERERATCFLDSTEYFGIIISTHKFTKYICIYSYLDLLRFSIFDMVRFQQKNWNKNKIIFTCRKKEEEFIV